MALSTTQYGYIIDPMVPFTDDNGNTIKDGFVRVFVAGSSTPVVTYRNFDGAANQDLIELDNSGRTKTGVIGSKGITYKVCVYDQLHSQESPILTVDKVSVIGANITAGAGATVVTGLDGLTTKPDGFVDASVVGTDGYVALDHTLVKDNLDTDAKVTAVENDRYVPLLNEDVNDQDSKMTLGRLWQWVLGKIKSLSTTITAFRTGDVIPVDGPSGTAKMSKDSLLALTAENTIEKFPDVLGLYSIGSSVLGYIGMQGGDIKIITSSGNKWRHFVCNVDVGKEYVVRTILGSGTTYIAEGDTATQTTGFSALMQNTSDPSNFKDYIVTPTKPYLFITYRVPDDLGDPWTQNDYKCFVIEKVKYTKIIAEEIDEIQDEDKRKTSILGEYDIGSSALGYIGLKNDVVKIISNAGNKWRHFVCKVDVGNQYVVRTILGSGSTYIAEGDTSTQTTGFTSLIQNTSDPTNLKDYVVTPSKPYLFITYRVPDDLGDPWTQNDYKCFVVNAKNYASESAEYSKTIILSQDSSSPINITQNTIVYGNGHHVNLGTELSLEFTGDIGEALYTASVDGDVYRCFVTQELPLSVSGDRPYYQVTLWAIDDNDVSNSIILTPKLTTTEVNNTTNSFTYDGTKFVVNVSNHSNYTRFVLNQDGNDGYCLICNGYKVRCYDVVFEFASFECAHVEGSRYCEFVNCEFAYPKAYNSLQTKDVQNVVLRNCTAHHANNDGFSVGYSGTILMEDCTGSYNQDDGVSNHGNRGETRFVIRGGEYHHNHKGGISSPVYGSVGDIHEVLLHDNHYGVYATNPTDGRTRYYKQTNKISGCHIYDNTVGIYASEYKLITWSNVLNNTTDYEEVNGGVIVR